MMLGHSQHVPAQLPQLYQLLAGHGPMPKCDARRHFERDRNKRH